MTTAMIDSETLVAEDVVKRLVAAGRAELDEIEQRAAQEKAAVAALKAAARRAVLAEIKAAIVADGQVPAELFPYMRPTGLEDDGACHNGFITVTVNLPGYPDGAYVSFKVTQSGDPGKWWVKREWMAMRRSGSGTVAYPTFAQAVAAEAESATNGVPL